MQHFGKLGASPAARYSLDFLTPSFRSDEVVNAGGIQASKTAVYDNLSAGTHTLSLWALATNGGSANGVQAFTYEMLFVSAKYLEINLHFMSNLSEYQANSVGTDR